MSCNTAKTRRLRPWLPAAAWYAVIFLFSAQPGTDSAQLSDALALELFDLGLFADGSVTPIELVTHLLRKGAHMTVYFVLAALLLYALRGLLTPLKRGGAALGLCALLAALDELHQYFVPGRSCQLSDVILDTLGGGCLVLLWAISRAVRKRRSAKGASAPSIPPT